MAILREISTPHRNERLCVCYGAPETSPVMKFRFCQAVTTDACHMVSVPVDADLAATGWRMRGAYPICPEHAQPEDAPHD